jgi:hypothetical protein
MGGRVVSMGKIERNQMVNAVMMHRKAANEAKSNGVRRHDAMNSRERKRNRIVNPVMILLAKAKSNGGKVIE